MLSAVIKSALKRGALITAANWELVVIQFVAESAFKALLVVPVVGAAFLLALLAGESVLDLLDGGLQDALAAAIAGLQAHPGALVAYLIGLGVVVIGGSMLMFTIKGGTVHVLVDAERHAPAVEDAPFAIADVHEQSRFSLDRFGEGCDRFRARFLRLGLALLVVYGLSGIAYFVVVLNAYRGADPPDVVAVPMTATAAASLVFGLWLTVVNFVYLLLQILVVARDWPVRTAARALPSLLVRERTVIGGVFLVMLVLVVLATVASVLATGALGFIGFVPIVGLAVLPLQLLAWLARGLLFQSLGLAAVGAYAGILRDRP
jgi:hypothetical protein